MLFKVICIIFNFSWHSIFPFFFYIIPYQNTTCLIYYNRSSNVKWTDSGVLGIIKNEKYKGDLLLGKSFTVDPISKRRLENMGEEEQYYIKNHHQPIISVEIWETAKSIREERYRINNTVIDGTRMKATRKYALSSM
ncbi:recombinase family protein [Anaerosporobacter sp.]|uniref:recombinase family protein n=1 Tax=Anaerosporobacter sp. TaxID=1872529 RepID=UPI00286F7ED5|nr:recombinase family protein [Anaerosporobacter sp.]